MPVPDRCADARHEFRVWDVGRNVTERIAERFDLAGREPVVDHYLVSAFPDVNVKIRDDELQVKRLLATTDGFQRWCPTWNHTGALDPQDLGRFHGELGVEPAGVVAATAELVALAQAHADLVVVEVTKHRRQGDEAGVTAEVTALERDDGASITTSAIEGTDLDGLRVVRAGLGLDDAENVAMPAGVARAWS